jgi:hypothetical protein
MNPAGFFSVLVGPVQPRYQLQYSRALTPCNGMLALAANQLQKPGLALATMELKAVARHTGLPYSCWMLCAEAVEG